MSEQKVCPRCQTANEIPALVRREYRCGGCGLELAHLDMAANGAVRGVFGWLLDLGSVVSERYRITGVLGKGGFGVTYLVEDLRLAGKRRALKEIPALLFDAYETNLLGRLNHPAIPDITDRLEQGGMVYLVLEFGGSRTLKSEQDRLGGQIPVFLLLPWVEQVCDALVYLHSQDPPIIHRDLKPDNILLDDNDRVMLIDFGIAKETGGEAVTRTIGRAVTHGFSPPEQVLGTGTDVRSDVYALGAILYAAITGKVPPPAHERVTGTALEPPASLVPEIPALLDATIRQALGLNLHARPQSVEELARTLALVRSGGTGERTVFVSDPRTLTATLGTHPEVRLPSVKLPSTLYTQSAEPAPPSVEPRRRGPARGLLWSVVGVALVGLAGGGAWVYLKEAAPEQPATPKTAAASAESTSSSPPTSAPGVAVPSPMPSSTRDDSGAAPQAAAAPLTPGDSTGSGDLPSVFSFEQEKPQAPGKHQPSDSLMELFEQQRAASQSKSVLPEPVVDPTTTTAGPSTVQSPSVAAHPPKKDATGADQPKPKAPPKVKTAETKPPKKTEASRTTAPKTPSSGASVSGSSRYTPEQLRAIKRFNDM